MTTNRIITLCILLLITCVSLEAQSRKHNRRARSNTTQVQQQPTKEEKPTTVAPVPQPEESKEPKYKSLSDPMVVRYLRGGFAKDMKLHLTTNADYNTLTTQQKQDVLNKVALEFTNYDINIYADGQQRELWLNTGNTVKLVEKWNNDSMHIERYLPLQLQRQGPTKVFYYVGGLLNGGNGSLAYSLNLRVGSYLYRNLIDASISLNLGGNKPDEGKSQFVGDVGVDSRAYLPFRIKHVNLAPYVGAGVSWAFAPSSFFEARFLAGGCWFIGPGSFDIGLQYGLKSHFAATLGYTFRIPAKKKHK